ncbi:MAG: DegV family protein [Chloroflexi bacterium]|nr:DegV family protein [Chloroflexota bacterium]
MRPIAVVTDSAACVPAALKHELDIREVPFELHWDGETFRDGENLSAGAFYRRLRDSATHPTTSQPTPGAFIAAYRELARQVEAVVSIHVAGELSGACNSARIAAAQVAPFPVRVVDSHTATIAEGFVVLAAARAAANGGSLDTVVAAAEHVRSRVDFYATLKSLEHVHRGGRLGDAAVLVGNQLRLIPIMNLREGRVSVVSLTRSWPSALERVLKHTLDHLAGKFAVHASVFHADAPADAEWLRERLLARIACDEFTVTEFTPVMGAHTGADVVGVAFYADA